MIRLEESSAVLLASGQSKRFGDGCKLLHEWRGLPLVAHAASLIARLPFMTRTAVVSSTDSDRGQLAQILTGLGFDVVENRLPERGRDHSLRLGVSKAASARSAGAIICLGDMPGVTEALIRALVAAGDSRTPAACRSGGGISPPCYFPRRFYADLVVTNDSRRPRDILKSAPSLKTLSPAADLLLDFDTRQDFDRR